MLSRTYPVIFLLLLVPSLAFSDTTVTKDNIRWTVDGTHATGQYVTGDWWVVCSSGCNITAITALNGETLTGSQKNPIPQTKQGLTSITQSNSINYDSSLNAGLSLPISMSAGDKLVSTTYNAYSTTWQTDVNEAAILTVVSSAPASTDFRPGICDTTGNSYDSANLDYEILSDYTVVGSPPALSTLTSWWARPWIDYYASWAGRSIHPKNNMLDYGGEICAVVSQSAVFLNSDYTDAQKEDTYIGMVQYGLDIWSTVSIKKNTYSSTVAHMLGRRFPMMLAGYALDIAAIKATWAYAGSYTNSTYGYYPSNAYVFEEDQSFDYLDQQTINVVAGGDSDYGTDYDWTSAHLGMPVWFHRKYNERYKEQAHWTRDPYRLAYYTKVLYGQALAVLMMGWEEEWDMPAMFDFIDERYNLILQGLPHPAWPSVEGETTGSRTSNTQGSFAVSMWDEYRDNLGATNPAPNISETGPSGVLPYGTTTATLTADATDNGSVVGCKANTTDVAYASMSITMTASGDTYTDGLTGLTSGDYTYYIRCIDNEGKENSTGTLISFSIEQAAAECDNNNFWLCETETTCVDAGHHWWANKGPIDKCFDIEFPLGLTGSNLASNPDLTWAGSVLTGWGAPYDGQSGSTVAENANGSTRLTAPTAWPPSAITQEFTVGTEYVVIARVVGGTDEFEAYSYDTMQNFYGLPRTVVTSFTIETGGTSLLYIQAHFLATTGRYVDVDTVYVYAVGTGCESDRDNCTTSTDCSTYWPGSFWEDCGTGAECLEFGCPEIEPAMTGVSFSGVSIN